MRAFGDKATFIPVVGTPFGITGVFDDAYVLVATSEYGAPINSVYPAIGVDLTEFPSPPVQGDHVLIALTGKTYSVREPRPDSHGGALLILNYVSG
jgi:hypothetical protein